MLFMVSASLAFGTGTAPFGESATAGRDDDIFHRGMVMEEDELEQLRGGFNIAGMELAFGAELSTRIGNQVQLISVMNVTRSGVELVSQSFNDRGGTATRVGPEAGVRVVDMTPAGINLAGLADFSGVTLQDAQGFTAALHRVTQDAILSGIVSNASGQDIQQRIDISVRVGNVGELQAAKQRAAIIDSFSGILR
ncbi:hypothetical protein C1H66_10730 [Halomonas heilongjiangensis]|uniref:Uncharacterized protein n=1 Tax=Halomonas heilongjiangensis TaxID=1387883 RepID=A0A2N7TMN9_9GAMM|nr:hypothetical protein C1H66_10730 [Halomonas heilongjiangensis]